MPHRGGPVSITACLTGEYRQVSAGMNLLICYVSKCSMISVVFIYFIPDI